VVRGKELDPRRPRNVVLVAALLVIVALIGTAGATGGAGQKQGSGCSVSPNPSDVGATYVVSAWGLPTGTAINLWVTDPNDHMVGSPLGSTPDGRFNLEESSQMAGKTTYAFSGTVKRRMQWYATCSVEAY
jgi:hypothetical protein